MVFFIIFLNLAKDFKNRFVYSIGNQVLNKKNLWNRLHDYEAEIYGLIKNAVGNADLAKDLFQDVYLQAIVNLDKLDPERSLKNWLITVARNRIINYFRERKRREFEELSESMLISEIKSDDIDLIITRALDKLPDRHREIIRLREIESRSYKEISDMLQLSESAITSLLKRSRSLLKKHVTLQLLPDWFSEQSKDFNLDDLGRFINSFDLSENLFSAIEQQSQIFFHHIRNDWNKWQNLFIKETDFTKVRHILGDLRSRLVLDIGCGTGTWANHFLNLGANIIALDLNDSMLRIAKTINSPITSGNFMPVRSNTYYLPLGSEQIDVVFFSLVLHHLADPERAINEAARVVRRAGKIVIIDFNRHRNHELADQMKDLWLGFKTGTIVKWCKKNKIKLETENFWDSGYNIEIFIQVYKKLK